MPEVTDPRILAQIQSQQASRGPVVPNVQPQPFPGPVTVRPNPVKQGEVRRAEERMQLDLDQEARAREQLEIERQRLKIAKDTDAIKQRTAAANSGVDTSAQAETAAGHAVTLMTNLKLINNATQEDPSAIQPGIVEGLIGDKLPTEFKGSIQSPQRQVVDQSYGQILESAIYLATGAAAQADQVRRLASALVPRASDDGPARRAKAIRLAAEIEKARKMAGPANLKVQEALSELEMAFPKLYGIGRASLAGDGESGETPGYQLSGTKQIVPYPEGYEAKIINAINSVPIGKLTKEMYLYVRRQADKEAGFNVDPQYDYGADQVVADYNAGHRLQGLKPAERELGDLGQVAADAAKSPTGTFLMNVGNAGSAGLPALFAGREGRFAMDLANKENPKAALAGDIVGSLAPTVAAESALARMGMSRVAADVGANAAYGGARGFNEANPGERAGATAEGMFFGGGGSLLGRGIVKGARGFMNPETEAAVQDLLRNEQFNIPSAREQNLVALPPELQGLDDAGLKSAADKAREQLALNNAVQLRNKQEAARVAKANAQTIAAHRMAQEAATTGNVNENFLAETANRRTAEEQAQAIAQIAEKNKVQQQQFRDARGFSDKPFDVQQRLIALAEENFPTTEAGILKQYPELAKGPPAMTSPVEVPKPKLETFSPAENPYPNPDELTNRIAMIEKHLSLDTTSGTGEIPGVDLTTLQRAGLGHLEGVFQDLPGLRGVREKTFHDWSRKKSGEVLALVGKSLPDDVEPGFTMNDYVHKELSKSYDELSPHIRGTIPKEFTNKLAALKADFLRSSQNMAEGLDERIRIWSDIQNAMDYLTKGGKFDGQSYRQFNEELRTVMRSLGAKGDNETQTVAEQKAMKILQGLNKDVDNLVAEGNPAAGKRLKALNKAYARQIRLDVASGTGPSVSAGGVPSPKEYVSAVRRTSMSEKDAGVPRDFSRGKAMDQTPALSAEKVMGDRPGREGSLRGVGLAAAAVGAGVGGAAAGAPVAMTVPALLAGAGVLSYTPGLKRLTQIMLDGKIGSTADDILANIRHDPELKKAGAKIPSAVLKNLVTQYIRAKAMEK